MKVPFILKDGTAGNIECNLSRSGGPRVNFTDEWIDEALGREPKSPIGAFTPTEEVIEHMITYRTFEWVELARSRYGVSAPERWILVEQP